METSEVKTLLGISTTTYDTDIETFTPFVWKDIVEITGNKFKQPYRWSQDDEWVFNSNSTSLTLPSNSTDDFDNKFRAGDTIYIEGSQWNDDYYSIESVTSSVMYFNEAVIDENSTDYDIASVIVRCEIPDYVKRIGAKMIWYQINNEKTADADFQSENLGDYSYTKNNKATDKTFTGYPASLLTGLKRVMVSK
jgi:hypothetical protein